MSFLTATEVTVFSDISASVQTIIHKQLIEEMRDKIAMKTNNYFVTDLGFEDCMTFNTTANTIIAQGNNFSDFNFLAGDDVFIYGSYRNDGYATVDNVDGETLTLTSAVSVIDELSGRSILVAVVKWPLEVKKIAARMIAYDYDVRPKRKGLTSRSLGPLSESFGEQMDDDGYPLSITESLSKYTIVRLM